MKSGLGALALLPGLAMAAPAVADKADNAFMMICTALVLFMTIPGIALFYGGLIRGKNVLSMLTQVIVTFGLVCVLWVIYGYTLAFGTGGSFFGSFDWVMLKNIELKALMGTFYQYIHVAFQGSFACITVGLIVGALAERIRFSAVLIFVVVWMTLSYVPIAHMVWGGGLLATHGALDFAGGTVVHINAAVAGLVGAYMMGKRVGFGKEAFKPHNLPMVFTGTAILYVDWYLRGDFSGWRRLCGRRHHGPSAAGATGKYRHHRGLVRRCGVHRLQSGGYDRRAARAGRAGARRAGRQQPWRKRL
ncbi:hypothetical protein NUBL8589_24310 [Klebsiella pneumoniae]|nr:hypothetical protein NUBL8589_24310 [Klebsiella pneumoniae]